MATYTVLQDIEAEDKLVGPLTLWQFIYASISIVCIYLSALVVMKQMMYFLIILVPVAIFVGFLAIPWGGDQTTEVWALAKLRFFLKPRLRKWDQSGMTELVEVTAPKHVERVYTDGLSQHEVKSRLRALASTLDSRGWAVKNVNVNLATTLPSYSASDRLFDVSTTPQETAVIDVHPGDDMLDENANPVGHTFSTMINKAATLHHQTLVDRMNQPLPPVPQAPADQVMQFQSQAAPPPAPVPTTSSAPAPQAQQSSPSDNWFMQQSAATMPAANPVPVSAPIAMPEPSATPQAGDPTADEAALLEQGKREEDQQNAAYSHLKTLKTPEQIEAEQQQALAADNQSIPTTNTKPDPVPVTSEKQAAIMNLSRSNDFTIDTLARQAKQELSDDDNEVVISLR